MQGGRVDESGAGAKQAMSGERDEMVERKLAHILDRGGMRHAANSRKRYLIHVAWFNLGIQMRAILGKET